jgi:hypothetical protein
MLEAMIASFDGDETQFARRYCRADRLDQNRPA